MKGRKKLPTNVKVLRGTFRPARSNALEPRPEIRIPPCPEVIRRDKEARREWCRMSRELESLGLVTLLDRAALSAYCALWSTWVDAEAKVREKGAVVRRPSDGHPLLNPYLRVASKALEQMKSLLTEFGLTPSSRTRVAASPRPDDDDDDTRFFKPPA
jgi:P27 family predicted phage terminase small subunit